MRKFQVREHEGLYSVVFLKDVDNRTFTYQHANRLMDLPYEEAVKEADLLEEQYKQNKEIIQVNDETEWVLVYIS